MDVPQVAEKHYEEHLDRWLLARSRGEDASEMPHARELRRAVRDLEEYRPKAHDALERVYLGKDADPALPARWLRDIEKDRSPDRWKTEKQRWNLHHLADARRYILHALYFEAERRRERGTVYYYQGGRPVCPVCWQELLSGEAPVRYPWPLVGDLGEIPVPPRG